MASTDPNVNGFLGVVENILDICSYEIHRYSLLHFKRSSMKLN